MISVDSRRAERREQPGFDTDGYSITDAAAQRSGDDLTKRPFVVLNDAPVGEGGNDDLLDATTAARGLTDLIIASREVAPFTLAIDAAWGMGKSSLMRQIAATLAGEQAVSTVWFNAWTSERTSVLEGLIKSVILSFDRNVIRRAVRKVLPRAHLVGALRAASLVLVSFFGLSRVVDDIWRTLALDAKSRNEIKNVVKSMAEEWSKKEGAPGRGRLLVVFIDDLDRCSNQKIIEVCEAIKLYLDVPGVVFVLACDQSVLWRAVRDFTDSADSTVWVRYLEKIVQVNYRIPAPTMSEARKLVNGYASKSGTGALFDDSMKGLMIERTGGNPRRIKRLINSFILEYHLNRSWEEVGVANLVKIVVLQHFYPDFYRSLLDAHNNDDPAREFLDYFSFREVVKKGGEREVEKWQAFFLSKGIKSPKAETSDEELPNYLTNLEQELPIDFPELAADRDFVSLLLSLTGSANSEQVRLLLRRRPLTRVPKATVAEPDVVLGEDVDGYRGMRVLWIDDHPDGNWEWMHYLTERGAQVTAATDLSSALEALPRVRPTVLLSDIARGDDLTAGLTDLEYLRSNDIYRGPVIFFVGQVTPSRLRRAEELGATGVTENFGDVLRWLLSVATESGPKAD